MKYLSGNVKALVAATFTVSLAFTGVAAAKTNITIENCANSHHEVKVKASNKDSEEISHKTVHSDDSAQVYCDTSKCDLEFDSGAYTENKTTNHTPIYVHVKDSHKIELSESSSLCN